MNPWARAAGGGAAGAAAVGLLTWSLRRGGWTRVDYGRIVGALLGSGAVARRAGRALFLANGALLGPGYLVAFRLLRVRPSATSGALLGAAHGLVALAGMAAAPRAHPRPRRAGLTALSWREGSTASAVLAGHVLFGAVVGAAAASKPRAPAPAGFAQGPGSAYLAG
jgi:hypothetical protein